MIARRSFTLAVIGGALIALNATPARGRESVSPFAFAANGKVRVVGLATRVAVAGEHPSWAPNGKQLVYAKLGAGRDRRGLYIAAADGSGERRVVTHGQNETIDDAD